MKRYCKNVDITDRTFIKKSILDCLHGEKNKFGRRDTLRMFSEYTSLPYGFLKEIASQKQYWMFDGIINTITEGIRQEIITEKYQWKEIWYKQKLEGNKIRKIGIQDIKQQLYDYIAVNGLMELFNKKIGYYQCAALPGKGQVFGKRAIEKWLRSSKARYGWKGDAKKYYENIDKSVLKSLLRKYVKNQKLLLLTFSLIDSFEHGLSIGSYLSQYLANFYMSFIYHFASEKLFVARNAKRSGTKRARMIKNILIYMDDIFIIGTNLKYLKNAVRKIKRYASEVLHVSIKSEETWINFKDGYIDIMGFLISKKKTIVRPSTFRKYRRSIFNAKKRKRIAKKEAYRIISRWGWLSNANCKRFEKRFRANEINKMSRRLISSGKNVIYFAAG